MTTPTPDEQALTEQIAEALRLEAFSRGRLAQIEDREEREALARTYMARAVLPVVKTAQRDAARGALTALASDERALAGAITSQERANYRLRSADAAVLFRDRNYPEETL